MLQGEETFKKGAKWLPGFDNNLDFWNDTWTSHGPLRKIIQGPLSREATNIKIKDVVDFFWKMGLDFNSNDLSVGSLQRY